MMLGSNDMRRKPSVAIVNNERIIATSLRMALEAEGFLVRTYADTASALGLIDDPADIALLDKTNPPLGGIELFRRLRSAHSMPVIFLSAWAEELQDELEGTEFRAEEYISLPFSQRMVIARVSELLRRFPPKPAIALVVMR